MRKEYDLKSLTVKRRGPPPELKQAARRDDAQTVKKALLKDPEFIRKIAAQVNR